MAALSLAACTKDEDVMSDSRTELRLTSGIEVTTRGAVQESQIEPDETVLVWVSDAATGTRLYNASKLTAQAGGTLAGATPMYFPQTGNAVNIRALHGTFSEVFTENETPFPTSVGFTVAADQSASGDAYVQSDLLYAASDNVSRTKSTVPLTFYHMLSKLELKIVKGEGVTDAVTEVTLGDVAVDGTFTPTEDADLSNQTARAAIIAAGQQNAAMTLGGVFAGPDAQNPVTNDAIVVPQAIGGKTMTFTLASGGKLVYTIPVGKKFEGGKKHVYAVTLKGTGLSVTSSVEPWDASEGATEGDATLPIPARIGDYFYSDGTYSTVLDLDKTVIGIVFQTDKSRIGQAEKDALGGEDKVHGLVMALKNAGTGLQWCSNEVNDYDFAELTNCYTIEQCNSDISGLHNYNTVIAYAENNNKLSSYPAFETVKNYNVAAPGNTTGWYLPALGQWYDFFHNLGGLPDWSSCETVGVPSSGIAEYRWWNEPAAPLVSNINAHFSSLDGSIYDEFTANNVSFWSSSEGTKISARTWNIHSMGFACSWFNKQYNKLTVRPVLAF